MICECIQDSSRILDPAALSVEVLVKLIQGDDPPNGSGYGISDRRTEREAFAEAGAWRGNCTNSISLSAVLSNYDFSGS